ncbi:sulfatase family protein [Paraglaciecola hydrolytica]|uniref:Arylsulfatase n=1 Tax=Paraglaciecola hydrolytica TaxID=1799789 RepID=A0A136A0Q3_9ALTE|nr:arylsulfatase [Paraglaciecola hydrolytica]KXI28815.1 arylsulfatase [Paraglaciecola hydrolytica]
MNFTKNNSNIYNKTLISFLLILVLACQVKATTPQVINGAAISGSLDESKPNIVIFYVDDLGYGDVGSYGAKGVKTPNIDALAANGIKFTDAHSSSATCTPSRYSLLTGEYAFRNKASVLQGDAALIISPGQPTLASLVKKSGYHTAVIGKWHLGLGDGATAIDWNNKVKPGPLEIGFDYSFLLPATGDRVPAVYLENHHVVNLDKSEPLSVSYSEKIGHRPTGYENPELLKQTADSQHNKSIINGISRIGWMKGGESAEWKDEDIYQVLTNKASHFISKNKTEPFFLFFSFHDIHVPRVPNKKFQGTSTMGVRGDAIAQMDWVTGAIVDHIKSLGILDNTLILFTSDNGPVLNDGYGDQAEKLLGEHQPGGIYRGGKYSAFEAGTRVPTIIHYPNKVAAGVNNELMSQIDIYASIAGILNIPLASNEAIDSENYADTWLNHQAKGRSELIEEAYTLSLRSTMDSKQWKYISPTEKLNEWVMALKNIEPGLSASPQLYNLASDPEEKHNVADQNSVTVNKLAKRLNVLVNRKTRE